MVPVEARSRFIRDREGKPIGILAIHRDITARKRAEEALKQQKDLYEALLKAQSDLGEGLLITDGQCIRFANDAADQISGYSAAELIALPSFFELVVPEQRDALIERFRQRLSGQDVPDHYQTAVLHKSGQRIAVEIAVKLLRAGDTTGLIITARDITERQRAEGALKESEQRYRSLFENANDAIISVSLDGTITAVNRGLEVATGWSRKELVGQHYDKLATPRTAALERERTRRALAGEKLLSVFEAEMKRKDGGVVPVEGKARFIRDREGKPIGYQTIFRDITERKRAEEALRESEERYRSVITALEEGIVLHRADGTIQACNASAERILGVSAESIKGQTSFDRQKYTIREDGSPFPAEEHPAMVTLRTGKPCSNVVRGVYKPDGELGWISINSQPLFRDGTTTPYAVVASFADITGRKLTEEALQKSEQRYRVISELVSNYAYAARIEPDGHYTVEWATESFTHVTGLTFNEEAYRPDQWKTFLYPEDLPIAHRRLRKLLAGQADVSEFRILTKSGEVRWVREYGKPVWDEAQGRVVRLYIAGHDITDRKQAEEEKQKLQEQLFQAQKMEALGTLAGGVAHDFNNILSAIMGFTELATDEVPESTVARRNLEEVLKACRRAKTLVKQILTFSRPHQQTLEPIRLQPIIEEVLTFPRASLPETIEVRRHIDKTAGPVAISPTQLQQVLTNLCANATQALRERSGVLEVSLQQIEVEDVLARTQNNLKPGPYIQLTVSDTGCGMTSAVQERIFEPFFTTRPVGEGNGLGLAIVHGIVTGYGGGITVESTPGKGTTFHVYLPVSENDVAPENILPYSPSPARGDSGDEKGAPSDTTHFGY